MRRERLAERLHREPVLLPVLVRGEQPRDQPAVVGRVAAARAVPARTRDSTWSPVRLTSSSGVAPTSPSTA